MAATGLQHLAPDVLTYILGFLAAGDIAECTQTCRAFRREASDVVWAGLVRNRLRQSALPLAQIALRLDTVLSGGLDLRHLYPHLPRRSPSAIEQHFFGELRVTPLDAALSPLAANAAGGVAAVQYVGPPGGNRAVIADAPFPLTYRGRGSSRRRRLTLPFVLALAEPAGGARGGASREFVGGGRDGGGRGGPRPASTNVVRVLGAHVLSYFEVAIVDRAAATAASAPPRFDDPAPQPSCVAVGLATVGFPLLGRMPGWDAESFGYHGDDGCAFHGSGLGAPFGPAFGPGDVVGCGLVYANAGVFSPRTRDGGALAAAFAPPPQPGPALAGDGGRDGTAGAGAPQPAVLLPAVPQPAVPQPAAPRRRRVDLSAPFIFFTLNGEMVGPAFGGVDTTVPWFPALGIDCRYVLRPNFGAAPFVYDVRALSCRLWAALEPVSVPLPRGVGGALANALLHAAGEEGDDGVAMAPPPPPVTAAAAADPPPPPPPPPPSAAAAASAAPAGRPTGLQVLAPPQLPRRVRPTASDGGYGGGGGDPGAAAASARYDALRRIVAAAMRSAARDRRRLAPRLPVAAAAPPAFALASAAAALATVEAAGVAAPAAAAMDATLASDGSGGGVAADLAVAPQTAASATPEGVELATGGGGRVHLGGTTVAVAVAPAAAAAADQLAPERRDEPAPRAPAADGRLEPSDRGGLAAAATAARDPQPDDDAGGGANDRGSAGDDSGHSRPSSPHSADSDGGGEPRVVWRLRGVDRGFDGSDDDDDDDDDDDEWDSSFDSSDEDGDDSDEQEDADADGIVIDDGVDDGGGYFVGGAIGGGAPLRDGDEWMMDDVAEGAVGVDADADADGDGDGGIDYHDDFVVDDAVMAGIADGQAGQAWGRFEGVAAPPGVLPRRAEAAGHRRAVAADGIAPPPPPGARVTARHRAVPQLARVGNVGASYAPPAGLPPLPPLPPPPLPFNRGSGAPPERQLSGSDDGAWGGASDAASPRRDSPGGGRASRLKSDGESSGGGGDDDGVFGAWRGGRSSSYGLADDAGGGGGGSWAWRSLPAAAAPSAAPAAAGAVDGRAMGGPAAAAATGDVGSGMRNGGTSPAHRRRRGGGGNLIDMLLPGGIRLQGLRVVAAAGDHGALTAAAAVPPPAGVAAAVQRLGEARGRAGTGAGGASRAWPADGGGGPDAPRRRAYDAAAARIAFPPR